MKVLITGFPYVRDRYFATFRQWPEPGGISFLLPNRWTAKDGKVVFYPPTDANVTTTKAYFSHSHYPLIGGLLKGFMPGFAQYLWQNRKRIDVVYACSEPTLLSTLYFSLISKLFRKKFLCFTWENLPYQDKLSGLSFFVHTALLRLNLFLSDGLVCGNEAGAGIHRRYTTRPITVIPMNGLDPEQFKPNPESRLHSQFTASTIFIFIGAIGYRKGIHLLLQALPQVLKTIPGAHIIIAGNGEYDAEIERRIHEPLIKEHVTRFGWLDQHEIVRLLSVSDVFVYPSIPYKGWAEQFGYSMAEASLVGLPVISTQSGSIADVVKDGETGILVSPNDVSALTDALVRLGKDALLRERLGRNGRKWVSEQFSHQAIAGRYFDFFAYINGQGIVT